MVGRPKRLRKKFTIESTSHLSQDPKRWRKVCGMGSVEGSGLSDGMANSSAGLGEATA